MVWFYALLAVLGEFNSVKMHFIAAVHTKKRCDASFGFLKRRRAKRDLLSPADILATITKISVSIDVVCSTSARFVCRKKLLSNWFSYPCAIQLTKKYSLTFSAENPRTVAVQVLSNTADIQWFKILKNDATVAQVRSQADVNLSTETYLAQPASLVDLPSVKGITVRFMSRIRSSTGVIPEIIFF